MELALVTLIITVLSGTSAYVYNKDRFKRKIFSGLMDYSQLMVVAFLTGVFIMFFSYIYISLSRNPNVYTTRISDEFFFMLMIASITVTAIGNGMHCASKNVSYYLKKHRELEAYRVNRFYHIPFSHNIVYFGGLAFVASIILFELNHPMADAITAKGFAWLVLLGIVWGIAWAVTVKRSLIPLRPILYFSTAIASVLGLLIYRTELPIRYLPTTIFFYSALVSAILVGFVLKKMKLVNPVE